MLSSVRGGPRILMVHGNEIEVRSVLFSRFTVSAHSLQEAFDSA